MPFDLTTLAEQGSNPFAVFAFILRNGGLVLFFPVFVWMLWEGWKEWIEEKYLHKKKYVLLAVDVPKETEQSMKAVEQFISVLHGVHFGPNKKEKYWIGVTMDRFALEIVSIDGYIQYFIRCDDYNADIVKGGIYAQYPDAEIVEVEDYVHNVPRHFPDKEWDMWGTEFVLAKSEVYPIKTYEFFEHPLTGVYADPLAAMLELLSRLRPGEQVWLQLIITPEGHEWREHAVEHVAHLIGKHPAASKTILDRITNAPLQALEMVHDAVFINEHDATAHATSEHEEDKGNYMNMTAGEKIEVEEIEKKASRLLYRTKFRFIYLSRKEVTNNYRVAGSVFGIVKQFNTLNLNALRAGGHTVVSGPTYLFVKRRQNKRRNHLMHGYIDRLNHYGETGYVLSSAEVATLFHFPLMAINAPLLSSTESKKSEPPTRLPFEPSPFDSLHTSKRRIVVTPPVAAVAPAEVPTEAVPTGEPQVELQPGTPLHSMAGLPPGVRPVAHPVSGPATRSAMRPTPSPVPDEPPPAPPAEIQQSTVDSSTPASAGSPPGNLPL